MATLIGDLIVGILELAFWVVWEIPSNRLLFHGARAGIRGHARQSRSRVPQKSHQGRLDGRTQDCALAQGTNDPVSRARRHHLGHHRERVYYFLREHLIRPKASHASNHPTASPVKEKYSPAAVSAQEITSMPLSNARPFSPISCTREITDSTSAAASAQRGQFLRRSAASQTK